MNVIRALFATSLSRKVNFLRWPFCPFQCSTYLLKSWLKVIRIDSVPMYDIQILCTLNFKNTNKKATYCGFITTKSSLHSFQQNKKYEENSPQWFPQTYSSVELNSVAKSKRLNHWYELMMHRDDAYDRDHSNVHTL